ILIDPLTNATVGAAMIRELLRLEQHSESNTVPETDLRAAITHEERVQRHGHRPAILTIAGDRRRAEGLERSLMKHGFETALVDYQGLPSKSRATLFSTLWNLGFVVLVWREKGLRPRDRGLLERIGGASCVDLSFDNAFAIPERDLENALKIVEKL